MNINWSFARPCAATGLLAALTFTLTATAGENSLLKIDNGTVTVGIDRAKGGSITWGHVRAPRKAMACFSELGQGIAVFSPAATQPWNFGPHGTKLSDDPTAGPCMHVAPLDTVPLGPKSEYRYRYWLLTGAETELAAALENLWSKYSGERAVHRAEP